MNIYLIVKALHIISVISWMAGMLYLPRLFVYHTTCPPGSQGSEMLKKMERRLMRAIINPAMIASWVFGLWMAYAIGWETLKHAGWFHVKISMLIIMQICHAAMSRWRRYFENDVNTHTATFYRFFNEVPTLLMIVIVAMVVIKPF